MNAAVTFAKDHSKHIIGAASVALISHAIAPKIWEKVHTIFPAVSYLNGSNAFKTKLKALAISTLAAGAVVSQVPPNLKTIVAVYAAAAILPAFAFKLSESSLINNQRKPCVKSFFSDKVSNESSSSLPIKSVLSIIGAAGLLYVNRSDLKPFSKYLLQNGDFAYKTAKPHFPAIAKAVAKVASGIVLGQGIGALVWSETIGTKSQSKARIPNWTGAAAKFTLLAATGGYLLNGNNLLNKYANVTAIIFSVGLGFSLFKSEEKTKKTVLDNWIAPSYSLRSSILPVDVKKITRAVALLGLGAAGLYLVHHPKIDRIFNIFIQRL